MQKKPKQPIPSFPGQHLKAIAKVLADTNDGLSGPDIGHILTEIGLSAGDPKMSKWIRLYNGLVDGQNKLGLGNYTIQFITRAMQPVRFLNKPELFESQRIALNQPLAFCGFQVNPNGTVGRVQHAKTIDEALERANRLSAELRRRRVHAEVLKYCNSEILKENYFHAVFEAMKSIAARIRQISGLPSDGSELVTSAFSLGKPTNPLLAINPLKDDSDESEQKGFVNLLIGMFGTIRNPAAHRPKIEWDVTEQDALDILTMASLAHRKLDKAYRYRR